MKDFFKVTDIERVFDHIIEFPVVGSEEIPLSETVGRILAVDVTSVADLPLFRRSTMDGYAVKASSSFGASEGNPAYLHIRGEVVMGVPPLFSIGAGEAAYIPTGGMLPDGADSVVMIEHAERLDETALEIYKSVAPGQNVIEKGEDFKKNELILKAGTFIRPQECGLMAAFGMSRVCVYRKPVVGIISTGGEIVSVDENPRAGQIE